MVVAPREPRRHHRRRPGRGHARAAARGQLPSERRIVALCLVGLSPAVVTETLYALAVRRRPRVVPADVHIVTTREGAARVTATLLGPRGALTALRQEYRLPLEALRCPPDHVHVLVDARGEPLDDIVTSRDSEAVGEQLAALVQRLGAPPGTALHCSLAGGRKTMGALLAMALQLHGGPQDRLYHVLVSPPWERVDDFFFPTRRSRRLRGPDGFVDARRAEVALAELPLLRLGPAVRRLGLSGLDLARLAAEVEAEAAGRLRLEPLVLDPARRSVRVGDFRVVLPAQQFALYQLYVLTRHRCRRAACRIGGRCPACQLPDDAVHDRRAELLALYRTLHPASARLEERTSGPASETEEALRLFREWLEQTRSRLNRALRAALGGPGPRATSYLVTDAPRAAGDKRRRGLGLQPGLVRIAKVDR